MSNKFLITLPSRPTVLKIFLLTIPVLLGINAYSHALLFALTPFLITPALFPLITWHSRSNMIAFALGASTLSYKPIADVLGDQALVEQITACALLCAISVAPWLLIRGKGRTRLITSCAASLIAILPPFGTIAAPNPYMAAGYLFPGTGIAGLALTASIIILPYQLKDFTRKIFYLCIVAVSAISNTVYTQAVPPPKWVGLETAFQDHPESPIKDRNERSRVLIDQITSELDKGQRVIITPESILGLLTPSLQPYLNLIEARAKRNNAVILVGVVESKSISYNNQYDNSLLILGQAHEAYTARQSVPFIMWNLWQDASFTSHWLKEGVRDIAGKRVALLICWEEWVPWPMLLSSLNGPEVIITASNHGWTSQGHSMWQKQTISANAIGRLYGLPMIRAVNLSEKEQNTG